MEGFNLKKKSKKNLKVNMSNVYIVMALCFILGFGFFGTSKIFIAEEMPVNQTELNQEFDLRSNGKFIINDWIYDEEYNKMEVVLVTNGIKDFSNKLDFTAVSRMNLKQELSTNIVYNDNEIYIIQIENVPKNFDQMAVRLNKSEKNNADIFNESEEVEDRKKVISTVYTDQRVVKRGTVKEKNFKEYAVQTTNDLIENSTSEIEKIHHNIEIIEKLILEVNEEIKRLKQELLYQTLDDQINTNNQIYRLEREIEGYEKDKKMMNENITNIKAKIERLDQKKRDLY